MDKTETYIKMCEKAVEIQEMRWERPPWGSFKTLEKGDYYVRFGDKRHISIYDGDTDDRFDENSWLPTQSDLQEMVRDKYPVPWVLIKAFARKVYWTSADTAMSMEQLWLAFVMMETYSKQWLVNSQEWVKI